MTDEGAKSSVTVTIAGESHQIRSAVEPDYTRRCAEYVDRAIAEVKAGASVVETHRAVILAALSITDELFRARERLERMEEELAEGIAEVERTVRSRLEG